MIDGGDDDVMWCPLKRLQDRRLIRMMADICIFTHAPQSISYFIYSTQLQYYHVLPPRRRQSNLDRCADPTDNSVGDVISRSTRNVMDNRSPTRQTSIRIHTYTHSVDREMIRVDEWESRQRETSCRALHKDTLLLGKKASQVHHRHPTPRYTKCQCVAISPSENCCTSIMMMD